MKKQESYGIVEFHKKFMKHWNESLLYAKQQINVIASNVSFILYRKFSKMS